MFRMINLRCILQRGPVGIVNLPEFNLYYSSLDNIFIKTDICSEKLNRFYE